MYISEILCCALNLKHHDYLDRSSFCKINSEYTLDVYLNTKLFPIFCVNILNRNTDSSVIFFTKDEGAKGRMGEDDPIFNIITSTVFYGNTWTKHGFDMFCTDCQVYEQQR